MLKSILAVKCIVTPGVLHYQSARLGPLVRWPPWPTCQRSPALALKPGETASHEHQTYHFSGPKAALDALAKHVLGVGLSELPPG